MSTTVFVHNGCSYQLETLWDPALAPYNLQPCSLRRWDAELIASADVVIVADYLHGDLLRPHTAELRAVAERGGTLVVFAENLIEEWLPGYTYDVRFANFWWWRTGEDHGMRLRNTESDAHRWFNQDALIWHQHGVITAPEGSVTLVALEENGVDSGATLVIDEVSTPGRILTTSMDPVHHHGSGFMPGATQLLYSVLRWATAPTAP